MVVTTSNQTEINSNVIELDRLLTVTEGKCNYLKCSSEKYKDLIKGKFKLINVMRIERSNDIDTSTSKEADYSSKPTDFTHDTIKKLIKQGEEDALKILKLCQHSNQDKMLCS